MYVLGALIIFIYILLFNKDTFYCNCSRHCDRCENIFNNIVIYIDINEYIFIT